MHQKRLTNLAQTPFRMEAKPIVERACQTLKMNDMKTVYSFILFCTILSISSSAQVIDTLNTRAETQQFALHEPGFDINQNDGTLYYGGTTGLYYSTDNGDSWNYNPFLVNGNERGIHYIEINQNTGRVYVSSTSGGFAYTDDNGSTWEVLNSSSSYAIHIENDICLAAVGPIFRFQDGDWANRVNTFVQADKITSGNNGYLYAVSEGDDKIYHSLDQGSTWEVGIDADDEAKFIIPKSNDEVIYSIWGEGLFQAPEDLSSDGENIGGTFLDGIGLASGFMWLIASNTTWLMSFNDGESFETYYGASTTELLNGVEPPSIDADGIRDQLDTYNGKIYLAETEGRIYTVDPVGTSIDQEEKNTFNVYPNPVESGNYLNIDSAPSTYQVFDISGRLISTTPLTTRISTAELQPGIYFIKAHKGEQSPLVRFIVR
jgi:hypothetical protein